MAMLDMYAMDAADLKAAFNAAAEKGARYLVLMQEVASDPMLVTVWDVTDTANSEADIVQMLQARNAQYGWQRTQLKAVYDTTVRWAAQNKHLYEETLSANLSPKALRAIEADIAFRQAVADHRALPWIQRVFTPAPVAPVPPVTLKIIAPDV